MPNSPNPFLLLTTDSLILMKFFIILNTKKNTEKKQSSLKYDVKTKSGPFFQSTRLFSHSQ